MSREEFRSKKSKDYRKRRESYGIKDPVYLDEIEEAYYQGMVDADTHPHWISVFDETPKVDMLIFVVQLGKVTTFRYQYERAEVLKNAFGITHWMPLPEEPKEGGEE